MKPSNLLQGLPHPVLTGLDGVDLAHEGVLRVVVDQVDALPALAVVDALAGDAHRTLRLVQGALKVLAGLHQVVSLIHVALKLRLGEENKM